MDFAPDGRIIYTNSDTQSQFISEMKADGSEQKPLSAPGKIDSLLNVSNDGRYIVFHSNRGGGDFDIWRMDTNGGNPKQLTFGQKNYQPFVSADNRWVYYKSWERNVGELRRVWIDGGEPEILNDKETSWVSFSPDGKYFAASYKTDKNRLAIFSAATNEVVRQFDLPKNATMSIGSRWTPDSRAVAYRDWNDGYWLQPIEGGEPRKMEGLPREKFYNFAWSKDGKQFAFVRGQEIRDVVLFYNIPTN
jgi:Tol biopolymer transport system component